MDPKRKRIFTLITICLPVVLLMLLELVLRMIQYGGNTSLFVTAAGDFTDYYICNRQVGRRFFMNQTTLPDPSNDVFKKKKPENGYRIFVLGGSTTAGYPYGNNLMFPRILHKRLADAFPDKEIEVVNTAMVAVNSYALMDFMDEILKKEPDAILIYAGHNEFYGALGVASTETMGKFPFLVKLTLNLKRYKTFLLMRNVIGSLRKGIGKIMHDDADMDPSATMMERLVAEQNIPYQSPLYQTGKKQFTKNLKHILKKAKDAQVPVVISELVSNIRDQVPFVSVETTDHPPADQVYRLAQSMEKEQRFDEARQNYYLAKDLDALRFRAPEAFNAIIHQVAEEFEAVVVPMESFFEKASHDGIIGNNLMLEHLHPNIDGYFIMADGFFQTMLKQGFIRSQRTARLIGSSSHYRQFWGVTALDSLYGDLRIHILKGGWPFQPKSAPNRGLRDFRMRTKAESLVVQVWTDKRYTLEHAHVAMAEHYEKSGRFDLAYREFGALMYLTPMNASAYTGAANMLIKQGELELALPLLSESLILEETAFANKWIGQILLQQNKVKKALPFLEKAYHAESRDPQLLYNLSGAYALDKQYEKAKDMLNALERINPNFPEAELLKQQITRILKN